MGTKNVWCVKTHIVEDYETTTDEIRLFEHLGVAEKAFNEIVEGEREVANDNEYVIECDDNRNFRAFEEDNYEHNHICVSLIYMEHLRNYPFQIKIE